VPEPTPERSVPNPVPSDDAPSVLEVGRGDVRFAVVSMSKRAADGDDAGYLRWHVLDHLPEQFRIDGMRNGTRWFSNGACRAARAASEAPYDAVDHIVAYLFGGPDDPSVDSAIDVFFSLGGSLHAIDRMPVSLPRVEVGGWVLVSKVASPRVMAGADVVPWRAQRGIYVVIEDVPARGDEVGVDPVGIDPQDLDDLVGVDGVAGVWRFAAGHDRNPRFDDNHGRTLTICYLDDDPVMVASRIAARLAARWAHGRTVPMLAGPFQAVVPWSWDDPEAFA